VKNLKIAAVTGTLTIAAIKLLINIPEMSSFTESLVERRHSHSSFCTCDVNISMRKQQQPHHEYTKAFVLQLNVVENSRKDMV